MCVHANGPDVSTRRVPDTTMEFGDITLHKWCVTIDQTGKLRVVLIVQAAYVTDRLDDEITLTEIFREVGVVYRNISTVRYLLAWRTLFGRDEVTKNGKVIGDKIVDGYPCNGGRRRGGDDEFKHITPVVRRVGDVLSHGV